MNFLRTKHGSSGSCVNKERILFQDHMIFVFTGIVDFITSYDLLITIHSLLLGSKRLCTPSLSFFFVFFFSNFILKVLLNLYLHNYLSLLFLYVKGSQ